MSRRIAVFLPFLALSLGSISAFHYGKGPEAGNTNAPGENSCQAEKCHAQSEVNSGPGSLLITGLPEAYQPGERYTLDVVLSEKGQKRWGFQLTTLDSQNRPAGRLLLRDKVNTQLKSAEFEDQTRQYIMHTLQGTYMAKMDGPVSWEVTWEAPPSDRGPIMIYTTANAANFNKKPWGDHIYARTDTLLAAL